MNPKEYNLFEKYQRLKRLVDSNKRIIIIDGLPFADSGLLQFLNSAK